MTTIDTRPDAADPALDDSRRGAGSIAAFFVGAGAWVTTTDHKRIGRIYVGFALVALLAVTVLATLLGIERADDSGVFLDSGALLQLFQVYRVGLVFAVAAPLGIGLAIAVVPLQLGARSLAFPRVALTGCYAWLAGLTLTMVALGGNGGFGGGDARMVDLFLAGHGLMILGLTASAATVATSVLTTRAPGMTMRRVPLFSLASMIGAIGVLLSLPVVFGMVVYLYLDHHYAQLNFGGSEGIATWMGWAYTVPLVVVFALPAAGVAAELFPVTFRARQARRGVAFAGLALLAVTSLAAITHQSSFSLSLDTDQSTGDFLRDAVPFLIFDGLPLLGMLVVMGLGALTARQGFGAGRPKVTAGFLFSFLGLGLIAAGLAGNLLLGIDDLELVGTVFEEGATVFVVYGAVLAVLGGLVFWAPKLWGRTLADLKVMPLALLGAAATVLAAGSYYVAGFADQTGGVPASAADVAAMLSLDYSGPSELWNVLALVGHGLMALTVVAVAGLMLSTFTGRSASADANPSGGQTIEWSTTSPAPAGNYEQVPTITSAEPLLDETPSDATEEAR